MWIGIENDDPMSPSDRDDYAQLTLSRFFRSGFRGGMAQQIRR